MEDGRFGQRAKTRYPRGRRLLLVCAGVVLATLSGSRIAMGQPAETPPPAACTEFRKDPLLFFFDLRAVEAVRCGQELLRSEALSEDERRRVLITLASVYLSRNRRDQAVAACREMLAPEPTLDLEDPTALPPPVVSLFYEQRDSLLLAGGAAMEPDIRTLAVGTIENNSLVHTTLDLDRFARGLTQILIGDLQAATSLKIVDRQRLNVLRQEIQLSRNEQISDPAMAVPFGRLCGAQSFLFGSLLAVDDQTVRLDLRWVNTSTGEVLLADEVVAKVRDAKDLFRMERSIVLEKLIPGIGRLLGDSGAVDLKMKAANHLEAKEKGTRGKTAYLDLLLKTGDAIVAEQNQDWASAEAAWEAVTLLAPSDTAARNRLRALKAQRGLASIEEGR